MFFNHCTCFYLAMISFHIVRLRAGKKDKFIPTRILKAYLFLFFFFLQNSARWNLELKTASQKECWKPSMNVLFPVYTWESCLDANGSNCIQEKRQMKKFCVCLTQTLNTYLDGGFFPKYPIHSLIVSTFKKFQVIVSRIPSLIAKLIEKSQQPDCIITAWGRGSGYPSRLIMHEALLSVLF